MNSPGLSTIEKWRLILGRNAEEEGEPDGSKDKGILQGDWAEMDAVLEALYDSRNSAGLSKSTPRVNRWLGDIRKYFPASVVQIMQKDAFERLDLKQMLLEPELLESLEQNVDLLATLIALHKVMPEESLTVARQIVRNIAEEMQKKLRQPLEKALNTLNSRGGRTNNPRLREIDWDLTIRKNLQYYQPEKGIIIPHKIVGFQKKKAGIKQDIFLLVDQSGSMAGSIVYAGIYGSILASLPSNNTTVIAFDTEVVDLTDHLTDPVELLLSFQLGGGTDISKAILFTKKSIIRPTETTVVLLSDLFEGGDKGRLLYELSVLIQEGVHFVCLLALNDEGTPAFDRELGLELAALGIPVFACTPDLFPDIMVTALMKGSLEKWRLFSKKTGLQLFGLPA